MADSDYLSAADLLNFNNTVQATNPYGIAGQSLQSWQPNMQTWSPTEVGVTSFAKTFLSSLLGNYARQDAADQMAKVVQVLPQMAANPAAMAVPEGVDAAAFNTIKGKMMLGDMMTQVLGKRQRVLSANEAAGKIDGQLEAYGLKPAATPAAPAAVVPAQPAPLLNADADMDGAPDVVTPAPAVAPVIDRNKLMEQVPGSPQQELATKNRKELFDNERTLNQDFTKDKIVQDFKYKEQGLKALEQAYKDTSGTSDFELIRRAAQMVEPGLAVRADDQQSLQGAASILGMSTQAIKAAASGDTKLEAPVRAGLMRIARRAYSAALDDYNTTRSNYLTRAYDSGLNPTKVVPYGAGKKFTELYPDLNIDPPTVATATGSPVSATQAQQIIAQAKLKYGDTPQAREIARKAIESLNSPRSNSGTPLG